MVRPMIARFRHWRRVGAGEPRQRNTAYISEPAMMKRPPETIVSGSAPPSSASRIPR